MKIAYWFKIAAFSMLLFAEIAVVGAQGVVRGDTVMTRPRPDYDAIGAPVGRFILYPEATLDFVYDDNILAEPKGATSPALGDLYLSDLVTLLAPAIALRSDWSRNALNVGGRALSGRYNEYSSQDFTDWELWTDGEYEFGPNRLIGNLSYSDLHEFRTSNDQRQGIFPTEFTLANAGVRYRFAPNRFYAGVALDFSKFDYDDAIGITDTGQLFTIDNQFRNRLQSELRLRAGYLLSPSYSLYAESRLYDWDYEAVPPPTPNFDQEGVDVVVGSDFDLTGVTSGNVFVGYRQIDYKSSAFQKQTGPVFGASVDWNITQLTTITFLGSNRLLGTTFQNSSGIQAVAFGIGADHELRRNVILSLDLAFIEEEYLQTPRTDDVTRISVGGEYFLNRYWSLNAGYRYQERESDSVNARQFEVNQFYLGIRGQI